MKTFGLIPAAGLSRRMGRPKLALPVAGRSVLEHVITAVRNGGVDEMLVVLGPHSQDLRVLAANANVHVLPEETPDMRATVLAGLSWLEDRFHPGPDDAWLLLPADHPTLGANVVVELIARATTDTNHSIFVPVHAGRRGHPTLLRWDHVAAWRQLPGDHGLNRFIRSREADVCEVPWPSDEVVRDLDTPEDYERLLRAIL